MGNRVFFKTIKDMNNIELEVARTQVRVNKVLASKIENIDWEQRRYEIAKYIFPTLISKSALTNEMAAERTVELADLLIEELKKKNLD